ncbi:hypothetical protein NDU88_008947 [Pleurodeles waltl]|uniref:Uncharacterized protein n=1 Tax=Pleurodeles waltl TaxID=8319 RepID=A0AAV7PQN2_PLEWA|nr:hypothetical protein NDU88_008947 [Pleurodeles waltl]
MQNPRSLPCLPETHPPTSDSTRGLQCWLVPAPHPCEQRKPHRCVVNPRGQQDDTELPWEEDGCRPYESIRLIGSRPICLYQHVPERLVVLGEPRNDLLHGMSGWAVVHVTYSGIDCSHLSIGMAEPGHS